LRGSLNYVAAVLLLKVGVPILVYAVGLIQVALLAKWKGLHDGRTTRNKWALAFLILLMSAGTAATCITVWRDNVAATGLESKIEALLSDNNALKLKLDDSTQQIVALGHANAELTSDVRR